jgi:CHAD domain-containing protein
MIQELRLESPAREAIRRLLSDALREATGHVARLGDPLHDEAVHDFRVAVRRLRTFLRAFSGILPIDDRIQLELRDLTGLTNATRDDEAHSEWLRTLLEDGDLQPAERDAVTGLLARLDARAVRPEGVQAQARLVLGRTGRALAECEGDAEDAGADAGQTPHLTFGQATAEVMDLEARRLRGRLSRIETVHDAQQIHRARLSEKRLRYVLEPVAEQVRDAGEPLERLRSLQDTLGELHDLSSLGERLSDAQPALDDVVRRRRGLLFGALAADWLGARADSFFADFAGITSTLRKEQS